MVKANLCGISSALGVSGLPSTFMSATHQRGAAATASVLPLLDRWVRHREGRRTGKAHHDVIQRKGQLIDIDFETLRGPPLMRRPRLHAA